MSAERILIVDDEAQIREIVSSMLSFANYKCRQAESGAEALAILQSGETFDLMLSELMMPGLNGIGLLEKAKDAYPEMPFVMVTAVQDISVALAAIRNGAYDYLLKPFEREQLLATVRRALEKRRLKVRHRAHRAKLKSLGYGLEPQECASTKRILVVDDEEQIREIVSSMLSFANYKCRQAESGVEALAILQSGETFDLILSDLMMADLDGIGLLEKTKDAYPDLPVIVVTAVHDISVALAAIRNGAYDYLLKPFEREQLLVMVNRALERRRLHLENSRYRHLLIELGYQVESDEGEHEPSSTVKLSDLLSMERPSEVTHTTVPFGTTGPDKDSQARLQYKNASLLSILHDVSNEFMVIGSTIDFLRNEPTFITNSSVEIETLTAQLTRCTSTLRQLLINDFSSVFSMHQSEGPHSPSGESLLSRARHDINGSLFILGETLTTVRETYEHDASPTSALQVGQLSRSVQRCYNLLRQTVDIDDSTSIERHGGQTVALAALVEAVLTVVTPRLTPNVNLVVEVNRSIGSAVIPMSLDRLVSVIAELITNAIHALQSAGGDITLFVDKRRPNNLQFVIHDNGPGIPPDIRRGLLRQPVRRSIGLGLGLFLSRELIRQHGGTLRIRSDGSGKGTRVTILIPNAEQR
jgi:DNA-binding response OmpR family regulator/anti-sigma regulatory factor (Ser/Thr protein kinase)